MPSRKVKRTTKQQRRIQRIIERDGEHCWICGDYCPLDDRSIDHVHEKAYGGVNAIGNLKLAHRNCNNLRSQQPEKVPVYVRPIRLTDLKVNSKNLAEQRGLEAWKSFYGE